jgi:hypothetical protein
MLPSDYAKFNQPTFLRAKSFLYYKVQRRIFLLIATVSSALLMRARNFEAMTNCRVIAQRLSKA